MARINKTNLGLYDRAMYLKKCANNGSITFRINLGLLLKFFQLKCIYPIKRVVTLDLKLHSDNKILIKPSSDTSKYSLHVTDISLSLMMVTFENSIRVLWYQTLDKEKLIRSLEVEKEFHFTLPKTTKTHYLGNMFSFARTPKKIFFTLTPETSFLGDHGPRHIFKHHDLKHICLTKNGVNHHTSGRTSDMDLSDPMGSDALFWYSSFLSCTKSKTLSFERFYHELFVFSYNLDPNPLHLMTNESSKDNLGLVSSGTIDASISFKENPSTNLILIVTVFFDTLISFNASGEEEGVDSI